VGQANPIQADPIHCCCTRTPGTCRA